MGDIKKSRTRETRRDVPYHPAAETSVLGGLMLDNDRWDEIAPLLKSTDFYLSVNQVIFRETERLVSAGKWRISWTADLWSALSEQDTFPRKQKISDIR